MHQSAVRVAFLLVALASTACGPTASMTKSTPSATPADSTTSAAERAAVGCALVAGVPMPPDRGEPAQRLFDYYALRLAHTLFVSATAAEPVPRFARLWNESDPLMNKETSTRAQNRARAAVVKLCRAEHLGQKITDYDGVRTFACRMARELSRERPHLSSYAVDPEVGADPSEPYGGHPYAIGLALTALGGLMSDWTQSGPDVISRTDDDASYVRQLANVLAFC